MPKKTNHQLAAQLFSFRDYCKTPRQSAATLKKLRKQGWRNVQISGPIDAHDPLDVKRVADDAGVKIIGHHTTLDELRNDLVNLIDKLHVWDCAYTAVASIAEPERKTLSAWKARAREMTAFGRVLANEGIQLQYHNHDFEFVQFGRRRGSGGKTGLELLYANSDPKYLQAEIDTCWVARGGGDPAGWITCLKGRIDQVHLKDTVVQPDRTHVFTAIGEGNLNWPAILKACKSSRVKDYIVEQDTCPLTRNPFKSFQISYRNLRAMGLK